MEKGFYAKVYEVKGEKMLAACDSELLGKVFREDKAILHVKKEFYNGFECGEVELAKLLRAATIINLVGRRCIGIAEEMGLVQKVMTLQGIPHVQIFEIR